MSPSVSTEASTEVRATAFVGGLFVLFLVAFNVGRLWAEDPPSYRMVAAATTQGGSTSLPVSLRDGTDTVTNLAVRHEKKLHLIAVSADFARYHHLHPSPAAGGGWRVDYPLEPGRWRLYADFQPVGQDPQVTRAEIRVPGPAPTGAQFPATGEVTEALAGGYRVAVIGDLRAGEASALRFVVSKDGVPVADLQPYLGAYGHLVVLREKDGAYLHAHPQAGPAGPGVRFHVEVPSAGRYHLYLDYQHDGVVRTAHLALQAKPGPADEMGGMSHGDH